MTSRRNLTNLGGSSAFDFNKLRGAVDNLGLGMQQEDPNANESEYYYGYTKDGQFARLRLTKIGEEEDEDVDPNVVIKEHQSKSLALCSSSSKLGNKLGVGIRMYFDFFRFLIFMNVILAIIQLSNYFMGIFWRNTGEYDPLPTAFYTSNFRPKHRPMWYTSNSVCLAVAIIFPSLFIFLTMCKGVKFPNFSKAKLDETDIILENVKYQKRYYLVVLRRMLSYGMLILLLLLQGGVAYGITYGQAAFVDNFKDTNDPVAQVIVVVGSVLIGLGITVVNVLYGQFATQMNKFEMYSNYWIYGLAYSTKMLIFRASQLILVNIAKSQTINLICPIFAFGSQYFSIMMTDLIVGNALQLVIPIVSYIIARRCSSSHSSNDDLKPEFNIAEEYISLIYRQFIIYNAMVSFPLAPTVGVIAGLIEYQIDKVKITKLTQKADTLILTSMNAQIILILAVTGLSFLAMLNMGGGPIYLMSGEYFFCRNYQPGAINATLDYCKTKCPIFFGALNYTLIGNSTVTYQY